MKKESEMIMDESICDSDAKSSDEAEKISFMDMILVLVRNKRMLLLLPIITGLIGVAVTFFMPNIYRAETALLPPQAPQSSAAALLSQMGGMAGMAAGVAGIKNPNDLYVGILKSRTIADRMVARFNLKNVYGTESGEIAKKYLASNTVIVSGKDGLISVEVEDADQALVAQLANGYVDELMKLTKILAVTEAAQRRKFFEEQLERSKNNLAAAEMALKGSLENSGVVSVDGESRALVEMVARLRASISMKEIELNSMRAFVTNSHPEFLRATQELNSLRSELSKLENGRGNSNTVLSSASGGLKNIQRLRDLKYYSMLYEMLAKQYESARLDEAKDPGVIQVLDKAVAPERHVRPKRLIIVAVATLTGLLIAMLWAFFAEARRQTMLSPRTAAKWAEIKAHLRA